MCQSLLLLGITLMLMFQYKLCTGKFLEKVMYNSGYYADVKNPNRCFFIGCWVRCCIDMTSITETYWNRPKLTISCYINLVIVKKRVSRKAALFCGLDNLKEN